MKHRTSIHFTLVEQIVRYTDRISSFRIQNQISFKQVGF